MTVTDWRDIGLHKPAPGHNVLLVTQRAFSAWELVPILMDGTCRRLIVTTFNISMEAIRAIGWMLAQGTIQEAAVVVSESALNLVHGDVVRDTLVSCVKTWPGRFAWRAVEIHAKIICMSMATGDAWVVEGSGNMARNANIEVYSLWNDPDRLAFHAEWIGGLL